MHLKVIACEAVAREIYYCAASARHSTDVTLCPQGLHDNSDLCRAALQPLIDAASGEQFDAVLLGYGLCNNSTVGLRAGQVRLVVPRAHDCITFFLGSKERYAKVFAERPGTFYYTSGWMEHESRGGKRVPYQPGSGLSKDTTYESLVAKYGEDSAQYLWESMSKWEENYTHGALIRFPFTDHLGLDEKVRATCREKGWEYVEIAGDLTLIQDWLNGRWDADRFLVLEPGLEITASHDECVLGSAPGERRGCES